jgi:hypothetical protein
MGSCLHTGLVGKCGWGFVYWGLLRYSKSASPSFSLYWRFVRGTWREVSFTGYSESYIRHVKEGFGNVASPSLYKLRECGERAPILGFCETCNGRLWKWSISFT